MTRRQLLRRGAKLCCHCIRNIAFYLSGWRDSKPVFEGQFWINANGNFLDIGVLEWCKLFGEKHGKHRWSKLITNGEMFFSGLLKSLEMNAEQWEAYIKEMRTYRDTFIAHLDLEERMQIPMMDIALKSIIFLYDYVLAHEDDGSFFIDAPDSALVFYTRFFNEGKLVYGT
jgi:hypothetical protein